MENLLSFAGSANWGYNDKNDELFFNSSINLYNYVAQKGAKILTTIEDTGDLQMVGCAFSYNARLISNGDLDINSVAAENAYYCLGKSIIKGNYFAAQELFNLIDNSPNLLMDKFKSVRMNNVQLSGNLNDIFKRDKAIKDVNKLIPHLKFYVVSLFYDIQSKKTKMPTDMIKYSESIIISLINELLETNNFEKLISSGQSFFNDTYSEIEDTLLKF